MKGYGNVSYRYFKRAFIKVFQTYPSYGSENDGYTYCIKMLKKTGQFFLGGEGGRVPFLRRSKKFDLRIKLCSLLSPGSKGSYSPTSLLSLFMPQEVRASKSKETTGATKHCDVY